MNAASLLGVCVTSALQSVVLVACVAAILRACRRSDATTRHRVWALALSAAIALPVVDFVARWSPPQARALAAFVISPLVVELFLLAWIVASATFLVRLAWSFARLERLRRTTGTAPPGLDRNVRTWAARMGIRRRVEVRTSSQLASPLAIGLLKPMIVIPQRLIETLSADDIDYILVHELAHLRRRDDLTNLVAKLARAVFVFNPVLLVIERRIAIEREIACDDWVVANLGRARRYARCLAHVLLDSPPQAQAHGYLNFFRSPEHSLQRIEMLLSPPQPARLFFVNAALVSASATIVLGMGIAASAPQIVAFDLPSVRVIAAAQLGALRDQILEPAVTVLATAAPRVNRALANAFARPMTAVAYGARPELPRPSSPSERTEFAPVRFAETATQSLDAETARTAAVESDANAEAEVPSAVALEMTRAAAARFGVGTPITPVRVPALALSYNSFVMAPVTNGASAGYIASGSAGGAGSNGSGSLDGVKLPGGGVAAPPSSGSHARSELPGQHRPGP